MKLKRIVFFLTLLTTISCGDYPTNGDLDGMWHLRSIESVDTEEIADVKQERIYYTFQQNLVSLKRLDGHPNAKQFIGRFIHTADSLVMHSFVVYQNEGIPASPEELAIFHLNGPQSRFAIKSLKEDKMVLRTAQREFIFKKF